MTHVWLVRNGDGGCTMLSKWHGSPFTFSRCDGGLWAIMTMGLEIFFLGWGAHVVRSDVFFFLLLPLCR